MISEPVARITKVLRLHGDQCTRANADYLAQRVAAELNLTEEKHTFADYETKAESGGEGVFRYAGQTSTYKGMKTVRRWVSGWTAVGETDHA